jgi:hypothetical protein
VAEKDKAITFLHVRHFFIRAIVEEYRYHGEGGLHPITKVGLKQRDDLPPGHYVYILSRATIRAAREQDALLPIIVNLQTLQALGEDASELCLARMVHEGDDTPPPSIGSKEMLSGYAAAESFLAQRFEARRASVERMNSAFVESRLASVRESYRLKISRKQVLLDNARVRNQPLSYIRMLEGTIRNLAAEQRTREAEIEQLRSVTAEHVLVAAGILTTS